MTKLIEGWIPKNTECPFKDKCELDDFQCKRSLHMNKLFSCALARAFDIGEVSSNNGEETCT